MYLGDDLTIVSLPIDSILSLGYVLIDKLAAAQRKASNALYQRVQVLQRHHFSSKLQRMSVITICNNEQDKGLASKTSSQTNELYCLVKGSPEAIKSLLVADHIPSW